MGLATLERSLGNKGRMDLVLKNSPSRTIDEFKHDSILSFRKG